MTTLFMALKQLPAAPDSLHNDDAVPQCFHTLSRKTTVLQHTKDIKTEWRSWAFIANHLPASIHFVCLTLLSPNRNIDNDYPR
jgi:hypothetical protein